MLGARLRTWSLFVPREAGRESLLIWLRDRYELGCRVSGFSCDAYGRLAAKSFTETGSTDVARVLTLPLRLRGPSP